MKRKFKQLYQIYQQNEQQSLTSNHKIRPLRITL